MLSIPEYFSRKNILITGGSGFVGLVLIEKLLRSCPDIDQIYLLIRNKKGKTPGERLKQITDNAIFDLLKQNNPLVLSKLVIIPGDISELGLGISEADEHFLISKINIIYHCAASIRFDTPLKSSILTIIRTSRELSNLALKCKALEVLVHVSTTYCNCDQDVIDEQIYPMNDNWKDLIALAEDDTLTRELEVMTAKFIEPFPNTYTFSKRVAENVIWDMCKNRVPVVICRPSIVVHSMREPVEGWSNNYNGPIGLSLAGTKGIIDIVYACSDTCLDNVHVDNVIKTLIMATWKKAMDSVNTNKLTVYNACSDLLLTVQNLVDSKHEVIWNIPWENRFGWGGKVEVTCCWYYYNLWFIVNNVFPALCADFLLKLSGKKPIVLNYVRKVYIANVILSYFMYHTFAFKNKGYRTLENALLDCDKPDFAFYEEVSRNLKMNQIKHIRTGVVGFKKYVLNEKWPIAPETFANTKKFWAIHWIFYFIKLFIILYILFWKWSLHRIVWSRMYNYVESL